MIKQIIGVYEVNEKCLETCLETSPVTHKDYLRNLKDHDPLCLERYKFYHESFCQSYF